MKSKVSNLWCPGQYMKAWFFSNLTGGVLMEENASERALKILYVDDDADDRQFFAAALIKLGFKYELTTASSCMELSDFLTDDVQYDIIFLDVNMPVKDGRQCLKEIKADKRFKQIPVIIFTVSQSERDIDELYDSGAHFHVIKPYAHINFVASLKIIFTIDWKKYQPIPAKEDFVINYSYQTDSE